MDTMWLCPFRTALPTIALNLTELAEKQKLSSGLKTSRHPGETSDVKGLVQVLGLRRA